MGIFTRSIVFTTIFFLAGCCCAYKNYPEPELKNDFYSILAVKYRTFADEEMGRYDWIDAEHFGKKSVELSKGRYVMPEDPRRWNVGTDEVNELWEARERLLNIMCTCMTTKFPAQMAEMQFSYDCWVEETAEWQNSRIKACKNRFYKSLEDMEEKNGRYCAPKKGGCEYIIHYDLDKDAIVDEHIPVLTSLIHGLRGMSDYHISIQGFTDTLASDDYNMDLGMRRAKGAMEYLAKHGVPRDKMSVESFGETHQAVPTANDVDKRANRRTTFRITSAVGAEE